MLNLLQNIIPVILGINREINCGIKASYQGGNLNHFQIGGYLIGISDFQEKEKKKKKEKRKKKKEKRKKKKRKEKKKKEKKKKRKRNF